jgi:hypothetical protein
MPTTGESNIVASSVLRRIIDAFFAIISGKSISKYLKLTLEAGVFPACKTKSSEKPTHCSVGGGCHFLYKPSEGNIGYQNRPLKKQFAFLRMPRRFVGIVVQHD